MRRWVIAATFLAFLGGCGSVSRDDWVYAKAGVSDADRAQDEQVCRRQAVGNLENKIVPTYGNTFNRDAYNDCMRTRGYQVTLGSAAPTR
jgi:hypothetical protein